MFTGKALQSSVLKANSKVRDAERVLRALDIKCKVHECKLKQVQVGTPTSVKPSDDDEEEELPPPAKPERCGRYRKVGEDVVGTYRYGFCSHSHIAAYDEALVNGCECERAVRGYAKPATPTEDCTYYECGGVPGMYYSFYVIEDGDYEILLIGGGGSGGALAGNAVGSYGSVRGGYAGEAVTWSGHLKKWQRLRIYLGRGGTSVEATYIANTADHATSCTDGVQGEDSWVEIYDVNNVEQVVDSITATGGLGGESRDTQLGVEAHTPIDTDVGYPYESLAALADPYDACPSSRDGLGQESCYRHDVPIPASIMFDNSIHTQSIQAYPSQNSCIEPAILPYSPYKMCRTDDENVWDGRVKVYKVSDVYTTGCKKYHPETVDMSRLPLPMYGDPVNGYPRRGVGGMGAFAYHSAVDVNGEVDRTAQSGRGGNGFFRMKGAAI